MDHSPPYHHGIADGASPWSQNLIVIAWVIYSPHLTLFHQNGLCIGSTTNNQVEYDVIIGLFINSSHLGINYLHVFLNSLLVVYKLNIDFNVCDPFLFRKHLHAQRLSRGFDHITFIHIPRNKNHIVNNIANQILDWHASHIYHHNIIGHSFRIEGSR